LQRTSRSGWKWRCKSPRLQRWRARAWSEGEASFDRAIFEEKASSYLNLIKSLAHRQGSQNNYTRIAIFAKIVPRPFSYAWLNTTRKVAPSWIRQPPTSRRPLLRDRGENFPVKAQTMYELYRLEIQPSAMRYNQLVFS